LRFDAKDVEVCTFRPPGLCTLGPLVTFLKIIKLRPDKTIIQPILSHHSLKNVSCLYRRV